MGGGSYWRRRCTMDLEQQLPEVARRGGTLLLVADGQLKLVTVSL